MEGDVLNAGLSFAALVPAVGAAIVGARVATKFALDAGRLLADATELRVVRSVGDLAGEARGGKAVLESADRGGVASVDSGAGAARAGSLGTSNTANGAPRLAQDVAVNPVAPRALPLNRPVGGSAVQNAFVQNRIGGFRAAVLPISESTSSKWISTA